MLPITSSLSSKKSDPSTFWSSLNNMLNCICKKMKHVFDKFLEKVNAMNRSVPEEPLTLPISCIDPGSKENALNILGIPVDQADNLAVINNQYQINMAVLEQKKENLVSFPILQNTVQLLIADTKIAYQTLHG